MNELMCCPFCEAIPLTCAEGYMFKHTNGCFFASGDIVCFQKFEAWNTRFEPRQEWDEKKLSNFIFKKLSDDWKEVFNIEIWQYIPERKHPEKALAMELAKALVQHFRLPAMWDEEAVFKLLRYECPINKNLLTTDEIYRNIAKVIIQHFSPPTMVVWPDKNNETDFPTLEEDSPELNKMIGWNACLAEFKRLNLDVKETKNILDLVERCTCCHQHDCPKCHGRFVVMKRGT